ncbi:hypothetical protein [Comamonas sp.]|uniref:hypothetical protein n=1 Tax=Comamonas sp. TaxID=34028 RepID=UPI001B6C7852|nr:hypothetical protein [Comamonas sp.]
MTRPFYKKDSSHRGCYGLHHASENKKMMLPKHGFTELCAALSRLCKRFTDAKTCTTAAFGAAPLNHHETRQTQHGKKCQACNHRPFQNDKAPAAVIHPARAQVEDKAQRRADQQCKKQPAKNQHGCFIP